MSIPDDIREKLFPYQIPHTENLIYSLQTYSRCLDASDTGTGKTFTSIVAAKSLDLKPFIICPKSVLSNWINTLNLLNVPYYGVSNYESIQNCKFYPTTIKNGKAKCPYVIRYKIEDKDDDNTDKNSKINESPKNKKKKFKKIKPGKNNIKALIDIDDGSIMPKKDKIEYTYDWDNLPDDIIFIFDETHRCKNPRTLNSILLYTLSKKTTKILMLSATVCDKPENFALTGFVLGLYPKIRQAKNWVLEKGKEFENVMQGVHDTLYPEYASRMRIKELGNLFPDNQIIAQCYDMENAEEIEEQYKLIEDEVNRLKNKEESSGCALSKILYARMRIEQLKIPTFIELANNLIEEGSSVAIFVNFTASLQTLADELNTNCVIYGEQTLEDRNKNIEDFNKDTSRIIICNIRSGGVGINLNDTIGEYPRVSLISPSWSAQDIIQALGRIHRANTKTSVRQKIIFCSGTVEEKICMNMKDKIKNIANLNDGKMESYHIEGLTDKEDDIGIDRDHELTEFEKMFQRINVLNIKKARLQEELNNVDDEIKTLEDLLQTMI